MSKDYTPLIIAKSFTKQYYEIIHKKPQQLYRFYKDESNFFHGEENQSTETISGSDNIREKVEQLNLAGAKVDLTDGSIDAQISDNNSVFLVVTGKFTMPGKSARPFLQSFFLVCQNGSKTDAQPSYYVRNSVFRLLGEDKAPVTAPADLVTTAVFEKKEDVVPEKEEPVVEPVVESAVTHPELTTEEDDEPTPEVTIAQNDELDVSTITSEPEYVNVSMKQQDDSKDSDTVEVQELEPTPEPVVKEKVKPASWACLFAGGGSSQEPVQQQAAKPKKVAPKKEQEGEKAAAKPTTVPPLTVYLCQLPANVEEPEIRSLFECFGNIKKIDIHGQKGYAFVDFSDASAVQNALLKKGTGYFTIRDTPIQVEERQTKAAGAGARGSSNNNNRAGRGGNSGGNRQNNQINKNGADNKVGSKGGNNNNKNNNRNAAGKAAISKQTK